MEGSLHSPPCVLDTGNPCRYDGCVNNIGETPALQGGVNAYLGYTIHIFEWT